MKSKNDMLREGGKYHFQKGAGISFSDQNMDP
jgi:hypothetical protein